jgi:hypothetical protein
MGVGEAHQPAKPQLEGKYVHVSAEADSGEITKLPEKEINPAANMSRVFLKIFII